MCSLNNGKILGAIGKCPRLSATNSVKLSRLMHLLHVNFFPLALGSAVILPLASCTTTSDHASSFSHDNSAIHPTQIAAGETLDSPYPEKQLEVVAGAPQEIIEMAAQDRHAQHREPAHSGAKPPIVLSSVPTTPVDHMPTNQIMMVRTTAYSHLQADSLPYGRKSAAGTDLKYGSEIRSAAADWSKYPMGTMFKIEGLPYTYVIDDYGSALCGTETIDIYKPNLSKISHWGVRNIPIRILKWGSFEESARILDSRKHVKHAHHVRKMLSEIKKRSSSGYRTGTSGGSA